MYVIWAKSDRNNREKGVLYENPLWINADLVSVQLIHSGFQLFSIAKIVTLKKSELNVIFF